MIFGDYCILSKSEQDRIEDAFNRQFPNGKRGGFGGGGRDAVANTVVAIFDNKCSVGWTSGAHTALPVDTSAYGVNSNVFSGMYENPVMPAKTSSRSPKRPKSRSEYPMR